MVLLMYVWRNRCLGIVLISISTIMLQVTYTRIFSIALWHHFVWMIVSIALFGFGISGTFLMIYPKISKKNIDKLLVDTSVLYAISTLLTYIVSNRIPFDPVTFSWDNMQLIYLLFFYLLLTIPFFLGGLISAIALERAGNRINVVYFSSFLGSAIGTIFVLPFFRYLGGSGVIVLTTIIAILGGIFFSLNLAGRPKVLLICMIFLIILLPFSQSVIPVRISPYKSLKAALNYQGSKLLETQWNSYSRVDLVESGYIRYAPGLSLSYQGSIPKQLGAIIDGSEINVITQYNESLSSIDFISYLPSYLPYTLIRNPRALVIDSGGGFRVLTALKGNASHITAVEDNSIIVDFLRDQYSVFSGNIYLNPSVELMVSDGRSYIQSTSEKFGLIDLSETGGVSPSSTGLYAVSENYLYTEEAFTSFLAHLSSDGILSVQRWLLPPPREDVRIVSLAFNSLEKSGYLYPEKHIAVYRSWGTLNLLVSKKPFNEDQLANIRSFCSSKGFDLVFLSDIELSEVNRYNKFPEPIYYDLVVGLIDDKDQLFNAYLFDIAPTSDDRPFFFSFIKFSKPIFNRDFKYLVSEASSPHKIHSFFIFSDSFTTFFTESMIIS